MEIDLSLLHYEFLAKPLLIGGKAMEYYGLRQAGDDVDFVISEPDHQRLRNMYPDGIKDLYGDLGICEFDFEIWNQICRFKYDFLSQGAIEEQTYLVASVEKMIFLKALALDNEKYLNDLRLLVKYARDIQYGKRQLPTA